MVESAITLRDARESASRKDWSDVRRICRHILLRESENAEAHHLLALAYQGEGRPDAAIAELERAIVLGPSAQMQRSLGALYGAANRWKDSVAAFERSLTQDPDHPNGIWQLGRALCEIGRYEEALRLLSRGRIVAPEHLGICTELGVALFEAGEYEHSYEVLCSVVERSARSPRARRYLAGACRKLQRLQECLEHTLVSTELEQSGEAWARLALVAWDYGDLPLALQARDRALRDGVADAELHSLLLYISLFDPEQTPESLRRAHRLWALTHTIPVQHRPYTNSPDADRKLRVGYVGMGMFNTPGRCFRLPLLIHANRDQFETFFYDTQPETDETAFREITTWRDARGLCDADLSTCIERDGIDVLVDLARHSRAGRPGVFTLKPAPVQVVYSGYRATTGLREFDAYVTDEIMSPPGTDDEYTEPLARIPGGWIIYSSRREAPEVTPLPAAVNGYVTFGVFQRAAKLSAECLDLIAEVLRELPDSRLLLHHTERDFDESASGAVRRVADAFESRRVPRERLRFLGYRAWTEHMTVVGAADIALDTLPFNGQTTTCECLWMGVPVVTVPGSSIAGRVGASLLRHAGMEEYVANSFDDYVRIALEVARDLPGLAEERAALRDRFARSRVCDCAGGTRGVEALYRELWHRWCHQRESR